MSSNKIIALIFAVTGAIAGIALLTYTHEVRRTSYSGYMANGGYTIHVHPHWAVIGGVASLIGGVVFAVLALAVERKSVDSLVGECPHCREDMRIDASVCPHCRRDVTPLSAESGSVAEAGTALS